MPKTSASAWSAAPWVAPARSGPGEAWTRRQEQQFAAWNEEEESWKAQQEQAWNARIWISPQRIVIAMGCQSLSDRAAERWCSWFARRGPEIVAQHARAAEQCEADFSDNDLSSVGFRRILAALSGSGLSVAVLKIFKNRIERAEGLAGLIRSGTVREIHASHNELGTEAAAELLVAAAEAADCDKSYCYPWWQDGGSQAPLWLRMEQNVLDPERTMELARRSLRVRRKAEPFCLARVRSCSTKFCGACHAGSMAAVHVPHWEKQRVAEAAPAVEASAALPVAVPGPPSRTGHRWGKLGPRNATSHLELEAQLRAASRPATSHLALEAQLRAAAEAPGRGAPSQAEQRPLELPKFLEHLEKPGSSDTSAGSEGTGSEGSVEESALNPTVPEFVPSVKATWLAAAPGPWRSSGNPWLHAPLAPPGHFTVPDPSGDFLLPECLHEDIGRPVEATGSTLNAHAVEFVPCQTSHSATTAVADLAGYQAGSILKAQAASTPGPRLFGTVTDAPKDFLHHSGGFAGEALQLAPDEWSVAVPTSL